MNTFLEIAGRLGWLLIGATVAWVLCMRPAPEPRMPVSVPAAMIEAAEPDTVRIFVDRIRYRTPEPTTVVDAPAAAVTDVDEFCRPALARALAALPLAEESVRPHVPPADALAPRLLLRSVTHQEGWFWRPSTVTLTGPLSTGQLRLMEFDARRSWSARTHADTVIFRTPRADPLWELLEAGVLVGLGLLAGYVLW